MVDEGLTTALERMVYGAVAITTLALSEVALEVTFPQWRVIVVVGETEQGAAVSEIASRIGSAVSPASKLVTRLERRGLLTTSKDLADRRVTRVRLTPEGHDLRCRVFDRRREYVKAIVGSVGPVPAGTGSVISRLADAFAAYS